MMLFAFEANFVDSLLCIPMQVRFKLDTCGIKLKLIQWHQFSQKERQMLVDLSCVNAEEIVTYRELLRYWVLKYSHEPAIDLSIDPNPVWFEISQIPLEVQTQLAEHKTALELSDWVKMTPLQRFALIKLSRSDHENHNFLPALAEFKLGLN